MDVEWRNPPLAATDRIVVRYRFAACPATPADPRATAVESLTGSNAVFYLADDLIPSYRLCVTVWVMDAAKRVSAPASTWLELPPRPAP